MVKKLNNITSCLILLAISACTSEIKKEVQKESEYIEKRVSIMSMNCDSINTWLNDKAFISQTNVYNQIGITDSLVLKAAPNSKEIIIQEGSEVHRVNRIDVLIANQKTTWAVYYTDELKKLIFLEIKSEDPNSTIYLSNSSVAKKILCQLVADTNFILNKFKITEPKQFIPPSE